MKAFSFFAIPALAGILLAGGAFAAEKESAFDRVMRTGVLKCGFIPWPPGYEVDPTTKEVKGPNKELFTDIAKLVGWKVEFQEVALGSNALDLNSGRIDAMCGDGPWVISSVKFVDYTTPLVYFPVNVYVREKDDRFKSYGDLNKENVTFAGIDGDLSVDLVGVRFPKAKSQTMINLTDPALLMRQVADGKADAVIIDPYTAQNFQAANPGQIRQIEKTGEALAVYPFMMSVSRGEDKLQQTLSRASEMAINIGLVESKLDLYDKTRTIVFSPANSYLRK